MKPETSLERKKKKRKKDGVIFTVCKLVFMFVSCCFLFLFCLFVTFFVCFCFYSIGFRFVFNVSLYMVSMRIYADTRVSFKGFPTYA